MKLLKLSCKDTNIIKYIRHENIISVEVNPGNNSVVVNYHLSNGKKEYTSINTKENYKHILKELGYN